MIGAGYNALAGEYGLAWQVVSWVLTVAVELVGLLAGVSLLVRKFGLMRAYALPDAQPAALSGETLTNGSAAEEGRQLATDRDGADLENGEASAVWFPHPDDPTPTQVSQTPKDA